MNEIINKLTVAEMIKTAKFIGSPADSTLIEEAEKELKECPSNYNLGVLLKVIADSLMNS